MMDNIAEADKKDVKLETKSKQQKAINKCNRAIRKAEEARRQRTLHQQAAKLNQRQQKALLKARNLRTKSYLELLLHNSDDQRNRFLLKSFISTSVYLQENINTRKPFERTFAVGIKEVRNELNLNHVKLLFIAPNISMTSSLWDEINDLIDLCKRNGVPYLFAFKRTVLNRLVKKKANQPGYCVAILKFKGVEEKYSYLLNQLRGNPKAELLSAFSIVNQIKGTPKTELLNDFRIKVNTADGTRLNDFRIKVNTADGTRSRIGSNSITTREITENMSIEKGTTLGVNEVKKNRVKKTKNVTTKAQCDVSNNLSNNSAILLEGIKSKSSRNSEKKNKKIIKMKTEPSNKRNQYFLTPGDTLQVKEANKEHLRDNVTTKTQCDVSNNSATLLEGIKRKSSRDCEKKTKKTIKMKTEPSSKRNEFFLTPGTTLRVKEANKEHLRDNVTTKTQCDVSNNSATLLEGIKRKSSRDSEKKNKKIIKMKTEPSSKRNEFFLTPGTTLRVKEANKKHLRDNVTTKTQCDISKDLSNNSATLLERIKSKPSTDYEKKVERTIKITTEPSNEKNEFFLTPVTTLRVNEANEDQIRDSVIIKTECDVSNDLSNNSATLLEGINSNSSRDCEEKTEKTIKITTEPSNERNEFFLTPVTTLRVNEANEDQIRDSVIIKIECDVSNDLSNNSATLLERIKSKPSTDYEKKVERTIKITTEPSNERNEFFFTPVTTLRVNEANENQIRDSVIIKTECDVPNDLSNNSVTLLEGINSNSSRACERDTENFIFDFTSTLLAIKEEPENFTFDFMSTSTLLAIKEEPME